MSYYQTQRASPGKPAKFEAPNWPPYRHAITSTSVTAPASRPLNTAPGGLACCPTARCISETWCIVCPAPRSLPGDVRADTHLLQLTKQHEKNHHDDTCESTVLSFHFLDRSPRWLFTVVQSGLLEMCGSEPPSLCKSFASSYCPAPSSLASQNSWLQNAARAIQCAVVARLSLVVSSSSPFFTCAQ